MSRICRSSYRYYRSKQVALALFRMLVQKEIGYKSAREGYAGLIDEAQNYMVVQVRFLSTSECATIQVRLP